MDLLDFARGPALRAAFVLFAFGVAWRLASLLLMPRLHDLTPPRPGMRPSLVAAGREIIRRSWPQGTLARASLFATVNAHVFHIGLAVVVFGLAAHILFIRSLAGIAWPNLPNGVIYAAAVATLASLLVAMARRITNPVLRLLTTADDYAAWLLTFLPLLTGLAASSHIGARYETLLGLHILCVALFLAWFPYGKLMHAILVFLARGSTGIQLSRRGAQP